MSQVNGMVQKLDDRKNEFERKRGKKEAQRENKKEWRNKRRKNKEKKKEEWKEQKRTVVGEEFLKIVHSWVKHMKLDSKF